MSELLDALKAGLANKIQKQPHKLGELTFVTEPSELGYVAAFLHNKLEFNSLIDITAVHYPERQLPFEIVYHFLSIARNERLRLKVSAAEESLIPSLCEIYPVANWYEREVYDMFGLTFDKHPKMERLLTDDGFEGHPLRKDFPVHGEKDIHFNEDSGCVEYGALDLPQPTRDYHFENPWHAPHYVLPGDEKAKRGRK